MAGAERDVVAIVDDDAAVRDSLELLLEIVGLKSEGFASGAAFLKADLQHIACLVLDYHMPGMTGLELVEHLRVRGVTIPTLLVTGMPDPKIVVRAAELGIARVVEKPSKEDEILAFIDAARAGHERIPEGYADHALRSQ